MKVFERMAAELYLENILMVYIWPYLDVVGYDNFILMQDNAYSYTAEVVNDEYLDEHQVERLD